MSNDHPHALMERLGLALPILQAPMAGVAMPVRLKTRVG